MKDNREKEDLKELIEIAKQLDVISLTLLKSNCEILLAQEQLIKKKDKLSVK